MATFTVAQGDLTNAVTFLEQFLQSSMPKYDFSEGTANRDIAINAMAYIVAFFRSEIADIKNSQSLLKLASLDPSDSVDEVVDEILSDWFVSRKTGRFASGYATLRFSRNDIGILVLTKEDIFTRLGLDFVINTTADSYTIQSTDLVRNTDNLGVSYYTVSIPLVAATAGSAYQITAGRFDSFPVISPFLTVVENLKDFFGGEDIETSVAMIARSPDAISTRTLNTEPAIKTVLTNTFAQVLDVAPVGMGDPEMLRDILEIPRGSGTSVKLHRGSLMDAYMKLPMQFEVSYADTFPGTGGLQVQSYTVGDLTITAVKLPDFPVYKIRALNDRSVSPAATVDFSIVTDAPELWNSSRQSIYLSVSSVYLGQFLDIDYDTVTGYSEVQSFVENKRNRILVADLLAKASFALYLRFELRYYPSSTIVVDQTAEVLALQDFIHGKVLGETFLVSEILNKFTTDYPGNRPQLPFVVVGELLLPNGLSLPMTYEDNINAPERYAFFPSDPTVLTPLFTGDVDPAGMTVVVLADLQVSLRTLRYVVGVADITLTAIS